MGRETERRDIRGVTYEMSQFGAKQGQKVALRVGRYMGAVLASLGPFEPGKLDTTRLMAVILEKLDEADFEVVTEALAGQTFLIMEGKRVSLASVYDAHFAGKIGALMEWLAWGVAFQFQDFFTELVG